MKKLWIASLMALSLAACGGEDAGGAAAGKAVVKTSSPDAALESLAANLENNNVAGLLQVLMPADELDRLRSEYEAEKANAEITDADRAEFERTMGMLTADDAVDQMMAMIEPQLAQMGPQLPMMLGMGQMMATSGIQADENMSADQKQQTIELMNATFAKLQDVDLANPDLAREALGKVTMAARAMELNTIEDMQALSFDDAVGKGSIALGALKDVFGVYGLNMNDMYSDVKAETVSKDGDNATVKVSYSVFGTEQNTEVQMTEVDGNWYIKDLVDQMKKERAGG